MHCTDVPNSRVNVLFCVASFRSGRRGPFVSAKGSKSSDAPSGLMRWGERWLGKDGPTRGACPEFCRRTQTRPAHLFERAPLGPDGRRRTMGDKYLSAPDERDRKCYVFRLARLYRETPYRILRMTAKKDVQSVSYPFIAPGLRHNVQWSYLAWRC